MGECKRCSDCCRKGGPTLHLEDLKLFEEGVLDHSHVLTIRRGEIVMDVVETRPVPLKEEIIKLRGDGQGWSCLFLDAKDQHCSIYEKRPAECRALFCEDTSDLEELSPKDRASRFDMVNPEGPLGEILREHENKASAAALLEIAGNEEPGTLSESAAKAVADILSWDHALRTTFAEKTGVDEHTLEFFFGRPLIKHLSQFGLSAEKTAEGELRFVKGDMRPS
jgi:Fe-S-cluster containining protein